MPRKKTTIHRRKVTIHREDLDARKVGLSAESTGRNLAFVTPGEVLREEFMVPMSLSARALARDLGIPANRITAILHGERAITADTALRLSRRFGVSAEFWMNLQTAHDLEKARRELPIAAE
jgi:addiction module HigA family antidote